MADVRVIFRSIDDKTLFIKEVNKIESDINIYKGSIAFDAKSSLGVYGLPFNESLLCSMEESEENKFRTLLNKLIV